MIDPGSFIFRRADARDRERIFLWANDVRVRAMSFSTEPIAWQTHAAWFDVKIHDPECLFYIIEKEGEAIGQVRFEQDRSAEGLAVISVSLAEQFRGVGLGSRAISSASELAFRTAGFAVIHAHIKPDNTASLRAFARAGYGGQEIVSHLGFDAVRMHAAPHQLR